MHQELGRLGHPQHVGILLTPAAQGKGNHLGWEIDHDDHDQCQNEFGTEPLKSRGKGKNLQARVESCHQEQRDGQRFEQCKQQLTHSLVQSFLPVVENTAERKPHQQRAEDQGREQKGIEG